MDINADRELDLYTADVRPDSRAYTTDPQVAAAFDGTLDPPGRIDGARDMRRDEALEQGLDLDLVAGDAETSFVDLVDANTVGQGGVSGAWQLTDPVTVDEIGRAIGIEYRDDEPLQSNRKMRQRDAAFRRWELDPASSDDWPHEV
ncbi:MAG: hypothetical protein EB084_06300 [Proteobacteria bacterium]|nr:hypothetical protein [Pseudomonadota bacterium]